MPSAARARRALIWAGIVVLVLQALRCALSPSAPPPATGARLVLLGTAQDGGLPQAGCACVRCVRARSDPTFARLVVSVAAVGRGTPPPVFLLDAGPDLPRQIERLDALSLRRPGRNPVDGVFLTHAHIGHYVGIAQFGREVMASSRMPVYGTRRMGDFLSRNGPWELAVRLGQVDLRDLVPRAPVVLPGGLSIEAVLVPHRPEYSDTVALIVSGPGRRVLFLPDVDSWDRGWDAGISPESLLQSVDVALVDGSFFSSDELHDRSQAEVGHPPMVATLERFEKLARAGRPKILFIHLNHTNPAADPDSPERARLRSRGFDVADEGMTISLE